MRTCISFAILLALSFRATPADAPEISARNHLNAARYEDAAREYASLIEAHPANSSAYYGRVRALLEAHHSADAFATADLALKNAPNTALAEAAAGLADIRRGEIARAENHFRAARKLDPNSAAAMSGLARIYSVVSLSRRARELVLAACNVEPNDTELMLNCANELDGAEHIAALEKVLPRLDPGTEDAQNLRAHLARDKTIADRKLRRLASPSTSTRIRLTRVMDGPNRPRGVGIPVRLNDKITVNLLLDTGASGIAISPKAAERAGLEVLSAESTSTKGIGDRAPQSSLAYLASEIRAGDPRTGAVLFENYPVHAFTSAKSSDVDGLIGADVFQRFVVAIDFPNFELQLEPRPNDSASQISEPTDRVEAVAAGFHRVFRFGNHLVIPTTVNDKRSVLFLLDTGSTSNLIDTATAREFTGVSRDSNTTVRGVQGKVEATSRAAKVSLTFAGFHQDNPDLLAISLEKTSDSLGVGLGGIIGMPILGQLKMTIDYREGTVSFEYGKPDSGKQKR